MWRNEKVTIKFLCLTVCVVIVFTAGCGKQKPEKKSIPEYNTNCIGHWEMDDNADNLIVKDSSSFHNDGLAWRNISKMVTKGKIAGALNFNGISDQKRKDIASSDFSKGE